MTETLIWANTNDQRNRDIILIENNDLNNFVPKIAKAKAVIHEKPEDIEITVNKIISEPYDSHNILQLLNNQVVVSSFLVTKFKTTECEYIVWNNFKPYLQWILDTSVLICKKCELPVGTFPTDMFIEVLINFALVRKNVSMHTMIYYNGILIKKLNVQEIIIFIQKLSKI